MLGDLIVLDLSRVLAGPYCTQLLADLGATVWKLEPPGGDDTRRWGPPFAAGESAYFLSVNRNKKGLAVDLKDPRGRALVVRLAERADVLVENFKTGDLNRYGLDYPTLSAGNPRLVYASITGFGQTGPRAQEPGYDAAVQALSGLMAMTGEPGRAPVKVGVAWVDVLTGVHAAAGILAAVHERERSGLGRHLDLSLLDVTLAALVNQAQSALLTGQAPARLGSSHPNIVPYQAFPTADGDLTVAVGNDGQFRRLCGALGLDEVAEDPRFASNELRVRNRAELVPVVAAAFGEKPRASWLGLLRDAGVPAAPVNTLPEALADPQVEARGVVGEVDHPLAGPLRMVLSPFGPAASARRRPPPLLGQHTREVLTSELNIPLGEIEELERDGVLKTHEVESR
jgi:crotonobetainyl-CoA:carnitine CoA-transferase CaiB-like acyl-CoA transferase